MGQRRLDDRLHRRDDAHRKILGGGGITRFVKGEVTAEGTPIMKAEGSGHLCVANRSKTVQILDLEAGELISVNANDILAFESATEYEINTVASPSEAVSGGLTNVYLTASGESSSRHTAIHRC